MTITIGIGYFARGGAPGRTRKYSALAPVECECGTEVEGAVMKIAKLLAGRSHSTQPRNGIKMIPKHIQHTVGVGLIRAGNVLSYRHKV
jgi:hypothetical protein